MNKRWLSIITASIFLASCGNPINRKTAENYHQWGLEAEWAGDYKLAERNYSRALINAQLGHSPDAAISMAVYNLGRMKGHLCKKEESEKLLLEALRLEEEVSGPISSNISKRLLELARLYYDYEEYSKATVYYERGIPILRSFNFEKTDPIAFADILEEFGDALNKSENVKKANTAIAEAKELRLKSNRKSADFVPVRYNIRCNGK